MAKKQRSEADKRYFNAYNGEKQRQKRLERHLKKHPNDGQAKSSKGSYRRQKPLNKGGWLTRKMAGDMYMGKLPGRNDDAATIVQGLTRSEQAKLAQFASELRAITNRLSFENKKAKAKAKG